MNESGTTKQNRNKDSNMSNQYIPKITRNNVTPAFILATFGKKSPLAGVEFPYISVTEDTLDEAIKYFTPEVAAGCLNSWSRSAHAAAFVEHYDISTGKLNVLAFEAEIQDITAGQAKKSDLQDRIDALIDENNALVEILLNADSSPEEMARAQGQIQDNNIKIKPLRESVKEIEAKHAVRVAAREANKAKKVAESPTQTAEVTQ